jgi:hypothetical protein
VTAISIYALLMKRAAAFHEEIGRTIPVLVKILEHEDWGVLSSVVHLLGALVKQGKWQPHTV